MTKQADDLDYAQVDLRQTGEGAMNLPANDRGRPQDDADAADAEIPGDIEQTPSTTKVPPDGDTVRLI